MTESVNHEQVSVKLANQLATVLYQKAVLETVVEQLQRNQQVPPTTEQATNPQET